MDTIGILQLPVSVSAGQDDVVVLTNPQAESFGISVSDLGLSLQAGSAEALIDDGDVVVAGEVRLHLDDEDIHFLVSQIDHQDIIGGQGYSHEGIDTMMDSYADHLNSGNLHLDPFLGGAHDVLRGLVVMPSGSVSYDAGTGVLSWPLIYVVGYFTDYVCTISAGSSTLVDTYDCMWVNLPVLSGQTVTLQKKTVASGWPGTLFNESLYARGVVIFARTVLGLYQRID